MIQTLAIIGTVLGGYFLLYGLEYIWKLLVQAPVALDSEYDFRLQKTEESRQVLLAENAELKKPRRPHHQQILFDQVGVEISGIGPHERKYLFALLNREEIDGEALRHELMGSGMSQSEWLSTVRKFRESSVHIVEDIPATPLRPRFYLRINPIYRDALLEILHGE